MKPLRSEAEPAASPASPEKLHPPRGATETPRAAGGRRTCCLASIGRMTSATCRDSRFHLSSLSLWHCCRTRMSISSTCTGRLRWKPRQPPARRAGRPARPAGRRQGPSPRAPGGLRSRWDAGGGGREEAAGGEGARPRRTDRQHRHGLPRSQSEERRQGKPGSSSAWAEHEHSPGQTAARTPSGFCELLGKAALPPRQLTSERVEAGEPGCVRDPSPHRYLKACLFL